MCKRWLLSNAIFYSKSVTTHANLWSCLQRVHISFDAFFPLPNHHHYPAHTCGQLAGLQSIARSIPQHEYKHITITSLNSLIITSHQGFWWFCSNDILSDTRNSSKSSHLSRGFTSQKLTTYILALTLASTWQAHVLAKALWRSQKTKNLCITTYLFFKSI